ncbi:Gfo/Idh/MocA family oxidoreductase [Sediminibacterium ginsengisoli]|uniref:Predicted dehydrogenase n=1 Tax=Sediminibacterium ginsengisoli TaxID=413434 RepID=A0A1T4QEE7_9BACT|nr:Gfo/Idh/MocA family oxidoreductase [Sediminibacterium ginsengisoli]SKA02180.1 Predicted dehydrogenase [Sediminibacterium ginsengisoli]
MIPVKTALLSFGMSGRVFHAPFIALHPGLELYGAWERTKSESVKFYPEIRIFRSLEELLADEAVELVIVNTPTNTHFEYAKKALEAGKHIVVEKAFTTTAAEAMALRDLAVRMNRKISVFQNRRWDSDFKTVKKVIDEQWLGDITEAEFHFDRYKEELSPKLHKELPGPGAGILYDLGPHIIDQALFLFGMPEAVFADLRITRPVSQVDDYFELLLYYNQLRVRLKSGYLVREALPSYIVHGHKGSFIKSRADIQEERLAANDKPGSEQWGREPEEESGLLHTEKNGIVIRKTIPSEQGNYYAYYDGVYRALREEAEMPVTVTDGIQVMQVIETAVRSSQEQRVIRL